MESTASAFQPQHGRTEHKEASIANTSDETAQRSSDMGDDDTSVIVLTPADYSTQNQESHHRLLDNPFKFLTIDEKRKHLGLEEFILKLNVAKAVVSTLEDRHIPHLQCSTLVRYIQELSNALSKRLADCNTVETLNLNAGLDDAIWESQETMSDMLQLLPKRQENDLVNGPGWEQTLKQVAKWLLGSHRLPRLQIKLANHVQVIKAQVDDGELASHSPMSSTHRTLVSGGQPAGVMDTFTTATADDDNRSTYTVPSLTTTATQQSSLPRHTSDVVSQPDLNETASETLDHFSEDLPELSDFHEITPDQRQLYSRLQVLEDAACDRHDSGDESVRNFCKSSPAAVAGVPVEEIRLCGFCTGYVEEGCAGNEIYGKPPPLHLSSIEMWMGSREDPWTSLLVTARSHCQATQKFSLDPTVGERRFYPFNPRSLLADSAQIAPKSPRRTKHSSDATLSKDLVLHPDPTVHRTIVKTTEFAGGAKNSPSRPAGTHNRSNASGNKITKKTAYLDDDTGTDHEPESDDGDDSGKRPPTSQSFNPNLAEYFRCIYQDNPCSPWCLHPFRNIKQLKEHLKNSHKKSTRQIKISRMGRPSEAENWRRIYRILRPGENVPNPYYGRCECSDFERSIGEANDLVFCGWIWEPRRTYQYRRGYFSGNDFRSVYVPGEWSQLPEHAIAAQDAHQRLAPESIFPNIVERPNGGFGRTPLATKTNGTSNMRYFTYANDALPVANSSVANGMADLPFRSACVGTFNHMAQYNVGNMLGTADSRTFDHTNYPPSSLLPCTAVEASNEWFPAAPMGSLTYGPTYGSQFEKSGAYVTNPPQGQAFAGEENLFGANSFTHAAYLDSDIGPHLIPSGNSYETQTTGQLPLPGTLEANQELDFYTRYTGLCGEACE